MKISTFGQRLVCLIYMAIFTIGSLQAQDSTIKQEQAPTTKFEGVIIARDNVSRLLALQNYEQQDIFFVKIVDKRSDQDASNIIKIINLYTSEKDKLPEQFFSRDKRWRFKVTRNPTCDKLVEKWNDNPNILLIDRNIKFPRNIEVPCYILKKQGIKDLTDQDSH